MQIVRTIIWTVLLSAMLLFSYMNWKVVDVQIWPGYIGEAKLPVLVIVAFLLGFTPMWLVHRAHRWSSRRRLNALETATARMAAPAAPEPAIVREETAGPTTPERDPTV